MLVRRAAVPLWKRAVLCNIKYLLSGIDWPRFYFQTLWLSGGGRIGEENFISFSWAAHSRLEEPKEASDFVLLGSQHLGKELASTWRMPLLCFICEWFLGVSVVIVFSIQRKNIFFSPSTMNTLFSHIAGGESFIPVHWVPTDRSS